MALESHAAIQCDGHLLIYQHISYVSANNGECWHSIGARPFGRWLVTKNTCLLLPPPNRLHFHRC